MNTAEKRGEDFIRRNLCLVQHKKDAAKRQGGESRRHQRVFLLKSRGGDQKLVGSGGEREFSCTEEVFGIIEKKAFRTSRISPLGGERGGWVANVGRHTTEYSERGTPTLNCQDGEGGRERKKGEVSVYSAMERVDAKKGVAK